MQQRLEQLRGTAATDAGPVATRTGSVGSVARRRDADAGEDVPMFGDVEPKVRMRMELLARASASPDTALPHVVALLVDGDDARDAIITAIHDNDALQAQWQATWAALRR
jgi:hypothetical protein